MILEECYKLSVNPYNFANALVLQLTYITYGGQNIPNTAICKLVQHDHEVGIYIISVTILMFIIPIITFTIAYFK